MKLKLMSFVISTLVLLTPDIASAQTNYPTKLVKLIVNYAAGGASDGVARAFAKALETRLGQPVTVENVAGGNSTRGITAVLSSPPDGYTIGIATSSVLTFGPYSVTGLPWGPPDTYDILAGIGSVYTALAAQPDSPYSTVQDLVSYAKKHPNELRVASAGGGVPPYVWGLFTKAADIRTLVVPYSGDADGLAAFLGKNTQLVALTWGGTRPHVDAGTAKPIAIFAPERLESHPKIPTFKESGYDITTASDFVIYAPIGVQPEIRSKIQAALKLTVMDEGLRKIVQSQGTVVRYRTSEELKPEFVKMFKEIGEMRKAKN